MSVAAARMYPVRASWASRRLVDYAILFKARQTALFMMTAWAGYCMGSNQVQLPTYSWGLLYALLGIGAILGGASALNQVIEREADACMLRTKQRPLPAHRMGVGEAITIGTACIIGGATLLSFTTNILTGLLSLLGVAVYMVYTPEKEDTPFCTAVGAVAGAMPPILGWTAARGRLGVEALGLGAILFLWQLPHFHSIEWLHREEYKCAGMRMLPVIEDRGLWTGGIVVACSLALLPVSLLPVYLGFVRPSYAVAALILGLGFLLFSTRFAWALWRDSDKSDKFARDLLRVSVVYLPLLFGLMMINVS